MLDRGGSFLASSDLCPHCGYNLIADEIVERDGFTIDPRGHVRYEGLLIPGFTPQMVSVMHSLAKANGRKLTASVIADRCGSENADRSNVVAVQICRLRRVLQACDIPCPVQSKLGPTREGGGYWWGV